MGFTLKNSDKHFENKTKLESLPWRGILGVLGGSFLIATVVNTVTASLLFPANKITRTRINPSSLVIPNATASLSPKGVEAILKRNIFNSDGDVDETIIEGSGEETGEEDLTNAVKSTLNVRLLGTIYGGDPFSGAAIIENTSKRSTNTFMVGDILIRGAKITEVLRERILIDNKGRIEYIEVEKTKLVRSRRSRKKKGGAVKKGIAPLANTPPPKKFAEEGFERDGSKIELTDEYRKKLLTTDFTKVLQDAKATPNMVDGELRGFRLTRIRSGSIYEKSGFQNDDIVEEINGVSLNDTSQAIRLLQSLRNESSIEIRINRNGSSMRFDLNVGG
jgi:general secretion pathway protein C